MTALAGPRRHAAQKDTLAALRLLQAMGRTGDPPLATWGRGAAGCRANGHRLMGDADGAGFDEMPHGFTNRERRHAHPVLVILDLFRNANRMMETPRNVTLFAPKQTISYEIGLLASVKCVSKS